MITALPMEVLMVDDEPGHSELVRRHLRRNGLRSPIISVTRGEHALDFVFRRREWSARPHAGGLLILLDLKMPGSVDGVEVLRQIKGSAATRRTPIVVLTTTSDPREVNRCYELGCSAYIVKPVEPDSFADSIRRLGQFLEVLCTPTEDGNAA